MGCLAVCSSHFSLLCRSWVGVAPLSVWARRVGVAVHVLPPEVGVAPLSACLWRPALSGCCSQPSC